MLQYVNLCSCQQTFCRTYKLYISNGEFILLSLAESIKLRNNVKAISLWAGVRSLRSMSLICEGIPIGTPAGSS